MLAAILLFRVDNAASPAHLDSGGVLPVDPLAIVNEGDLRTGAERAPVRLAKAGTNWRCRPALSAGDRR